MTEQITSESRTFWVLDRQVVVTTARYPNGKYTVENVAIAGLPSIKLPDDCFDTLEAGHDRALEAAREVL